MKRVLVATFFVTLLFGEDFISEFEYGQMLYQSPRGVSCASCHGKLGEPTYVATLVEDNGTKIDFITPDIRRYSLEKFRKALEKGGKIMPKYYLTKKEIEAIYKYIKEVNTQPTSEDNNTRYDEIGENITDLNDTLDDYNKTQEETNDSIISKIFKLPNEEQ